MLIIPGRRSGRKTNVFLKVWGRGPRLLPRGGTEPQGVPREPITSHPLLSPMRENPAWDPISPRVGVPNPGFQGWGDRTGTRSELAFRYTRSLQIASVYDYAPPGPEARGGGGAGANSSVSRHTAFADPGRYPGCLTHAEWRRCYSLVSFVEPYSESPAVPSGEAAGFPGFLSIASAASNGSPAASTTAPTSAPRPVYARLEYRR